MTNFEHWFIACTMVNNLNWVVIHFLKDNEDCLDSESSLECPNFHRSGNSGNAAFEWCVRIFIPFIPYDTFFG